MLLVVPVIVLEAVLEAVPVRVIDCVPVSDPVCVRVELGEVELVIV